jgi:hypothetical protein
MADQMPPEWAERLLDNLLGPVGQGPLACRLVTGTPRPAVTLASMIEHEITEEGAVFYLLACRECGNGDLVMPFSGQEERGKWAAAHTRGTGHNHWLVTDTRALEAEAARRERPSATVTVPLDTPGARQSAALACGYPDWESMLEGERRPADG